MNLAELASAAAVKRELERAQGFKEALWDYKVVGITVDRELGTSSPISLASGRSGNGSITGIGWPSDLEKIMTKALEQWYEKRITDATAALREMGIEVE